MITCELSPLGFHLSVNVKEKIWRGDYIDLLSLIPSPKEYRTDKKDVDDFKDDKRKRVPQCFNIWLQAFRVFASVLGEKRSDLCCGLFQHVEINLAGIQEFPWAFLVHL